MGRVLIKIKNMLLNIVHLMLLCGLGVLVFSTIVGIENIKEIKNIKDIMSIYSSVELNDIFTFIGAIAFILFGVVGIYEYAYLNGLGFIVPPTYRYFKQKNDLKQAEKMMEVYYERDIRYIQEYEKERADYLLQALGIEDKQFKYINYKIIKARTMPDRCIYDLKCKVKTLILHKEFVINQSTVESSKRVYDKVDYFLNMYTALYNDEVCKNVVGIMERYLVLSLKEKITEIDYIVIPKGSNFLLGLEVGKLLHKPVISILHEERIFKDVFWDGVYDEKETNNIIVLHDVLVTGQRIYESIEKLPSNTYNLLGIFCVFRYNHKDYDPISVFEEHGIAEKKVNCLFDIDENLLKKVYEGSYESSDF